MRKRAIDDKIILEHRASESSKSLLLDVFAQILKRKFSEKATDLPNESKETDNATHGKS